jgi:hypothetical protein
MTSFLLLFLAFVNFTAAFTPCVVGRGQGRNVIRCPTNELRSSRSNLPNDDPTHEDSKRDFSHAQVNFLESSARDGSSAVRLMSVEERTKRALLAEAAEDRMMKLTDDLDKLLGDDGMPKNIEDREEAVKIARQIKASQEQYRSLVNGEPSPLIDALDGSTNNKGLDPH